VVQSKSEVIKMCMLIVSAYHDDHMSG